MTTPTTLSGFTVAAPNYAPTIGVGAAAGQMTPNHVYGYKCTFVTQFGETTAGPSDSFSNSTATSFILTNIPVSSSPNVIARRIYRTEQDGAVYYLLAEIDDNITTTYVDTASDDNIGPTAEPTANKASSRQVIGGMATFSKPICLSVERGIIASGTDFATARQIAAEYTWISTAPASSGVKLPCIFEGMTGTHLKIRNNGANTINIYPYPGQKINNGTAGAAVTLAINTSIELVCDISEDNTFNWAQL